MSARLELSVSCYEGETPSFVAHELNRLYGGRYSSLAHFQIYGQAGQASTYVVRRQGQATSLFLYRRRAHQLRVLNEGIRLGHEEAARFATHMFAVDKSVSAVVFRCVDSQAGDFRLPCQRVPCAQDSVLALPSSLPQYMDSLGASTRSTIKYRMNKLKRDFPTFSFRVEERGSVAEQAIRDIIRLNRARMSRKDKVSAIDAQEERRIIDYVRECGFVGIATIDGRFCAGAITYRLGNNFAARILAHDAAFDAYRLGFVCAFLTIGACIEQGGAQFCFGWGQGEYKSHLGATQRQLHHVVLYRSRWHRLRHPWLVLQTAACGWLFRARMAWLPEGGRVRRAAAALLRAWRARSMGGK
ncbi:MAG: GNAT family N-acetyltransferase [Pseudomonadota bacterium]